jgi:hypothetical protein
VSEIRGTALRPSQTRFNKHVLFQAKDGLASMGVTGYARLGSVPTDQWIASTLAGEELRTSQDGPGHGTRITAFPPGRLFAANWPSFGQAIEALRATSARELRLLPAEYRRGFMITIAGWQWKYRACGSQARSRPIGCLVGYDEVAQDVITVRVPRYWGWERERGRVTFKASPALPKQAHRFVMDQLKSMTLQEESVISMLLGVLRDVSVDPTRGVGRDCLSVSISVGREPKVIVRYHPDQPGLAMYTGWIVSPELLQPPQDIAASAGTGPLSFRGGFLTIDFLGTFRKGDGRLCISDQESRR